MGENSKNESARPASMQLHPLLMLREVGKKFLAVILAAVIAMSCTYVIRSYTYKPKYQTKTTFVVSIKNGSNSVFSNLNAAKETAISFAQILKSDLMKKQLMEKMKVAQIDGEIEAKVVSETNILELKVTAHSPQEAFAITKTLLDSYEPLTETVLSNVTLDILQYPSAPTAPTNPLVLKWPVVLAGLLAAAAAVLFLCAIAYLRDTVKTSEDAETKLDTKVLGTVHYEKKYKTLKSKIIRKKTSILITRSTTGFNYVESFKKLRTRLDYNMHKNNCKVLAVTSASEDEGKSTVSVNIALAMSKKYKKVLLIDADMKKSALYKILDYGKKDFPTLSDVLTGKASLEDAIVEDSSSGMYLLLSRSYGDHSTELIISRRMQKLIDRVRAEMDVVVIDTPPMAACPDAECIAELADASVLVIRQDMTPIKVLNDMIDILKVSRAKLLGCVLNNFRATDLDDKFTYGSGKYGYGKYGYGKYGYSKYGYSKYGYGNAASRSGGDKAQGEEE